MGSSLRIESYTGVQEISSLESSWKELFDRLENPSPYLSYPWISVFLLNHKSKDIPVVFTVYNDQQLVLIFPVFIHQYLWLRSARPIGDKIPSYLGLLQDPECPQASLFLAKYLLKYKKISFFYSENLILSDIAIKCFIEALCGEGCFLFQNVRNPCYYIKLTGSFEDYLIQTKSSKRRKQLQNEEKKLFSSFSVKIKHYKGGDITEDIYDRIVRIQEESWMKRRGAAVLGQPFNRFLLLNMAKANMARLWLMEIDGEDAAFVFILDGQSRYDYYRTAFKLKYLGSFSIGKILTMWVIRDACSSSVKWFDFGHGAAEYKSFWSSELRDVKRVIIGRGFIAYIIGWGFYISNIISKVKIVRHCYHKIKSIFLRN